jgi:flagellar P-ring protein precursor FlgI
VTKNHPTAGIISNGALVERAVPTTLVSDSRLVLNLNEPDHVTASRMAAAINAELAISAARAIDAASISVNVPLEYGARVSELIARLEPIQIIPDAVAKVVVNERTGTVVVGSQVSILPVAVAHAGLTVDIATDSLVSQPAPLSQGETTVVETSGIGVVEPEAMLYEVQGTTVQELVRSLNAIKASPRDIIAILQAIKRSGALQAELEVI